MLQQGETNMNSKIHHLSRLAALLMLLMITVSTQAANQCIQPPSGIIAWWPFDETSGNTVEDRVGNHTGAYANNPVPVEGKVGGSLRFNGTNYVAVLDSDDWAFGTKDFTVELWANFDVTGGGSIGHPGDIFIGNDEGPGSRRKWFFALGGGNLNFHINSPSIGARFFPLAPFSPAVGQWYHLAVTKSGTTYTLFINGTPVASATDTNPVPNANAPLTIGQAENLGFMNGRLDEVTIYNRALTQAELQAIVIASTNGKCKDIQIQPRAGGDTGNVTVNVIGSGFSQSTLITLTKEGQVDIFGTDIQVSEDGRTLKVTFDLTDKPKGLWNVVLNKPYNMLPDAFQIESAQASTLSASIMGLPVIRADQPQEHWIYYQNNGNVNVESGHLFLRVPKNINYKIGNQTDFTTYTNDKVIDIFVNTIPAKSTRFVPLTVKVGAEIARFQIGIAVSDNTQGFMPSRLSTYRPGLLNESSQNNTFKPEVAGSVLTSDSLILIPGAISFDWRNTPPGYVHYFTARIGDGSPFTQTAIRYIDSDGRSYIAWSFPHRDIGSPHDIEKIPLEDFILNPENGQLKYFDNNPEHPDITLDITLEHRFAIRPFSDDKKMQALRDRLPQTFQKLKDLLNNGFCKKGDIENKKCESCIGFVTDMIYYFSGMNPPWDFTEFTEITALTAWLKENGYDEIVLKFNELYELESPEEFKVWAINTYTWLLKELILAFDPNDKVGAIGNGNARFVSSSNPLVYSVLFENKSTASGPAQEIVIRDQLDLTVLKSGSLMLGPLKLGDKKIVPPTGVSSFSADIDLRPDSNIIARAIAGLDPNTGMLTWHITALDPLTGNPTNDPLAGVLPPNINPPEGDGSVVFTVMPKPGLPTGTEIRNKASIVFDTNAPIETPEWLNTIDNAKPESQVLTLPATQTSTSFKVEWSGNDVGAGVKDYSIFVSENGGTYNPWLTNVADTSGIFTGNFGKIYSFYSVARDLTGNIEDVPVGPDTTTQLVAVLKPGDLNGDESVTCADMAIVKASFGKRTGQAGFDPRADVNKDGIVDIRDLSFVSRLLPAGTKCS